MPLIIGIDEAGYGPTLGPLVVAATAWRVPPRQLQADLWETLSAAVARESSKRHARLAVGDSKAVYDRKKGLATLERTVLAFVRCAGLGCGTIDELMKSVGAKLGAASDFPWYQQLNRPLPTDPQRAAFTGAAERLRTTTAAAGVACAQVSARVVTEDAFNDRVRRTRNKSAVVIEQVLSLVDETAAIATDIDVHIHVDRLGGRADYRALLAEAFPDRVLHVLEVSENISRYRLAGPGNDWHVDFTIDSEQKHLPVALASMTAKYLRELLMEQFNRFWRTYRSDLVPTAGYYTDAQRFLADIAPVVSTAGIPAEHFIRVR